MNKRKFKAAVFGILLVPLIVICFLLGYWIHKKDIPFTGLIDERWSIGIYTLRYNNASFDATPLPASNNPILTVSSVSNLSDVHYVADPFIISNNGVFYLFFEVLRSQNGDIGLATSADGIKWDYQRIVLDEPFHLSYPFVFQWENQHYMIPESSQASALRLYRAESFPYKWRYVKDLITDIKIFDPTVFRYNDKWWLFGSDGDDNLYLYSAKHLNSEWVAHPRNPIVKNDPNIARPGGNVIQMDGQIYRITQDCSPTYGNAIRAFHITQLNDSHYYETEIIESPLLRGSGVGWNANAMHHLSTLSIGKKTWIAAVDGRTRIDTPYFFVGNVTIPVSAKTLDHFKSIKNKLLH